MAQDSSPGALGSSHQGASSAARLWRPAPQPDIVRAAQKDELYLQQSIDACHDAVVRAFGAVPALQHAKSCRLLATFMYYATTTAAGLQTLGEEYCDIMQLTTQQQQQQHSPMQQPHPAGLSGGSMGLASTHVRVLLTLLESLGPALLGRLIASLDRASEQGRLLSELQDSSADEQLIGTQEQLGDAYPQQQQQQQEQTSPPSESFLHQQQHYQQQQHQQHAQVLQGSMQDTAQQFSRHALQLLRRSRHQLSQTLVGNWPVIKSWLLFAGRVHLAAFYLHGRYYEWSKRLLGVQYTSISPNKEQRASYRFLGYMLVLQLVVSGLLQARSQLAEAAASAEGRTDSTSRQQGLAAADSKHAVLLPDPMQQQQQPLPPAADVGTGARDLEPTSAAAVAPGASSGLGAGSSKQCPLCLSVRTAPTCTPCGHVYCWHCIAQWCLEKPECPLCRDAVLCSQLVCLYHSDF